MPLQKVPIDFWFAVGSTYAYLTVSRLPSVQAATGVPFRWRPFDVRAIMIEMENIPFSTKPAKEAYMWRDIERRAANHGLPFEGIPPYPLKGYARANRVATVAAREGWIADFAQAAYRKWFLERLDPGDDKTIAVVLGKLGQHAERVLAAADSDEVRAALARETDTARSLGIFGSPTFVVGKEIFWGDDRLEDALRWHGGHSSLQEGSIKRKP